MGDKSNKNNDKCGCNNRNESNKDENNCRFFDSDIYGGFQDLNPELFVLMGNILGLVMGENMPFNIQNAVGNWLCLVGQSLITYNSQQQYFENGPGRPYNPIYRNVSNSFCQAEEASEGNNGESDSDKNKKETISTNKDLIKRMEALEKEFKSLKKELEGKDK